MYQKLPPTKSAAFTGQAGISRAKAFFKILGDPQEEFKSIHIAGTSGKGSVNQILTALLVAHGKDIGSYTSPHIYDIRERFQLNGKLIDEKQFLRTVEDMRPFVDEMAAGPEGAASFFEIANGLAFRLFSRSHVDYAVIETGLGGLYDSTNSISRSDKLSIITRLGYDHTEVLGDTLAEIAAQKAGIINYNSDVIALKPDSEEALKSIKTTSEQKSARLKIFDVNDHVSHVVSGSRGSWFDYSDNNIKLNRIKLGIAGRHQVENAAIALKALEFLSMRDGFDLQASSIQSALSNMHLPGRFELLPHCQRSLILDGAHNPQKMEALIRTLKENTNQRVTWILAFKDDKDMARICGMIAPVAKDVIVTKYGFNPDSKLSQPADPSIVVANLQKHGVKTFEADSAKDALDKAVEETQPGEKVVVAGSIYLVGEIGRLINYHAVNSK